MPQKFYKIINQEYIQKIDSIFFLLEILSFDFLESSQKVKSLWFLSSRLNLSKV